MEFAGGVLIRRHSGIDPGVLCSDFRGDLVPAPANRFPITRAGTGNLTTAPMRARSVELQQERFQIRRFGQVRVHRMVGGGFRFAHDPT
jgi:hypothetical protein